VHAERKHESYKHEKRNMQTGLLLQLVRGGGKGTGHLRDGGNLSDVDSERNTNSGAARRASMDKGGGRFKHKKCKNSGEEGEVQEGDCNPRAQKN